MKRELALLTALFLLLAPAFAAQPTLQELKQKVVTAQPKDQPKLYIKIAEMEMKSADEYYKAGDAEKGQAVLPDLISDCEKAAAAAKSTRKHMKNTEIALRNIENRLDATSKSLTFDERAPVKDAIDRIEHARNSLVNAMFAK